VTHIPESHNSTRIFFDRSTRVESAVNQNGESIINQSNNQSKKKRRERRGRKEKEDALSFSWRHSGSVCDAVVELRWGRALP